VSFGGVIRLYAAGVIWSFYTLFGVLVLAYLLLAGSRLKLSKELRVLSLRLAAVTIGFVSYTVPMVVIGILPSVAAPSLQDR
jgi:hypothetical protein